MRITKYLMIMLLICSAVYSQNEQENRKVELSDGTFIVPDKYPELIKPVRPVYPRQAILQDIQGKVYVKVTIAESGKVEGVKIAQGINPVLNKSALAAAKKMMFSPAVYKGKPVKVSIAIPVNFILDPGKKGPPVTSDDASTSDLLLRKADKGVKVTQDIKSEDSNNKGDTPDPDTYIAVEKNPEPITRIAPEYPKEAIEGKATGFVVLRVLVSKEGKPLKAVIVKADHEIFVKPAIEAVMKTMFTPAIQNGKPIMCWINIPYRFALANKAEKK